MSVALMSSAVRATHIDTGEELLIWGFDGGPSQPDVFLVQDREGMFRYESMHLIQSNYRFDPAREAAGMDGWHDLFPLETAAPSGELGDDVG